VETDARSDEIEELLRTKLPPPPAALTLPPTTTSITAGSLLWRVYFRGGGHPGNWSEFRAFGPTDSRFDHHVPPPRIQSRAILYAAAAIPTCLAEVYQRARTIDRNDRSPWLVGFRLAEAIELLDLTGTWPTRAGASTLINSGPRSRARLWSRAIYEAYPPVEGLSYASSMHGQLPMVALYERAESKILAQPEFNRPLNDPILLKPLKKISRALGYALV